MNPEAKRLWIVSLVVVVAVVIALFACCVVLAFTTELRLTPSN